MITPDIFSSHVFQFCRGISAEAVCLVPVEPQNGFEHRACVDNAKAMAARHGGSVVFGWHIVEWPGVYVEAQPHVVWRQDSGTLLDPTPHGMGFEQIAFLADPSLSESAIQQTISHALVDDPILHAFFEQGRLAQRDHTSTGVVSPQTAQRAGELLELLEAKYKSEPFPADTHAASSQNSSRSES